MGEILSILKNDEQYNNSYKEGLFTINNIGPGKIREMKSIAGDAKKYANSSKSSANNSESSANTAVGASDNARASANTAVGASDNARASANTAVGASDNALDSANTAVGASDNARASANTSIEASDNALDSANTSVEASDNALDSANTSLEASDSALDSAATAEGAATEVEEARNAGAYIAEQTLIGSPNSRTASMGFTNIKEGMVPNQDESAYDLLTYLKNLLEDTEDKKNVQKAIYRRKLAQSSEILAQDDNILSNILFDYMAENEEGSNIEKVYKKLDAENKNKMRKIQINTYYTKAYKEYIYLLKITVLLIAILIPILILNKIELLGKNYTLIIIVTILFLGFLYIFYRLYILYMRDDINFDKFRVPYDRQAHQMYNDGKLSKKDSPLKGLGITCVGDECCDASMIYDNLANKCVMQENFGNYFEKMNNMNNSNINVVKQFDNFDNYRENFITNNTNLKEKKNDLLAESLTNTRRTTFDTPNTRI